MYPGNISAGDNICLLSLYASLSSLLRRFRQKAFPDFFGTINAVLA